MFAARSNRQIAKTKSQLRNWIVFQRHDPTGDLQPISRNIEGVERAKSVAEIIRLHLLHPANHLVLELKINVLTRYFARFGRQRQNRDGNCYPEHGGVHENYLLSLQRCSLTCAFKIGAEFDGCISGALKVYGIGRDPPLKYLAAAPFAFNGYQQLIKWQREKYWQATTVR